MDLDSSLALPLSSPMTLGKSLNISQLHEMKKQSLTGTALRIKRKNTCQVSSTGLSPGENRRIPSGQSMVAHTRQLLCQKDVELEPSGGNRGR